MAAGKDYPTALFADAAAWERWLAQHHADAKGVWLHIGKKGAESTSLTLAQAVEVALCYGWIDGQANRHDEQTYLVKFTPRGRRSVWSKINRNRAEALIAEGRMHAAGLAAVESARADGRWDRAYDSAANATVPDDLQRALDANVKARTFFETLTGNNRYAILYRIQTAVRPDTRARRIAKFVAMLERGETVY